MLAAALTALTVTFWPPLPGLRTAAAILDSLVPQLVALAAAGALLLVLLRVARPLALLACGLTVLGGAVPALRHVQQAAPPAQTEPAVRVLWWNMLFENSRPPEELAAAIVASGADIVVLGEALAATRPGARAVLDRHFPQRAGCTAPERRCDLVVLARDPAVRIELRRIGRADEARLAVIGIPGADGTPALTLVAVHLVKPWFFGFIEGDGWALRRALAGIKGPVVVVGDFNAAPWSGGVQALIADCALAPVRRPVATWPEAAGRFGVPIDLMLLGGGATASDPEPWGDGLGSNHRGLLAGIALPPPSPAGARAGCPQMP